MGENTTALQTPGKPPNHPLGLLLLLLLLLLPPLYLGHCCDRIGSARLGSDELRWNKWSLTTLLCLVRLWLCLAGFALALGPCLSWRLLFESAHFRQSIKSRVECFSLPPPPFLFGLSSLRAVGRLVWSDLALSRLSCLRPYSVEMRKILLVSLRQPEQFLETRVEM
ncbi:hypothetical protein BKA80DRAFT_280519 [Phyllosticta citrichinensis]